MTPEEIDALVKEILAKARIKKIHMPALFEDIFDEVFFTEVREYNKKLPTGTTDSLTKAQLSELASLIAERLITELNSRYHAGQG